MSTLEAAHTGAVYFERITALASDRRARTAFQQLALRLAPPGGALLDFGAGPGIDARFLAERGLSVDAYDVDPAMCEFFASHCREFIATGRIALCGGGYEAFLAREALPSRRRVDLVISNFAPLNHIDDLRPLFAKLHGLTVPRARILASVLTPYFIGDVKTRWWWRHAPRLWREGHFFVRGVLGPSHTRRRLADFAAASAPHFRLTRAFRGLPPLFGRQPRGVPVSRGSCAWVPLSTARFMFLLFERCD